jgi:sugar/nucleoside kinase (ribokinase family)
VLVLDALCGPLPSYPVAKVRPQVNVRQVRLQPGGGAANTSAALAQIGISVALFTKAGTDAAGDLALQQLNRLGVDTAAVVRAADVTTPFTFVGIHPDGDRTFVHAPGANRTMRVADFDQDRLLDAEFLFYQDHWVLPESDGRPGAELLRRARDRGRVTLLDECWGLGPRADTLEAMLPFADYVLPSYEDLLAIYPGLTPAAMAQHLRRLGAGCVVLKLGAEGCLVCDGGEPLAVPSSAGEIVDTTGAGDCFDAGFIAGLAHGLQPRQAAVLGSRAAAACIAHVGGAAGIPTMAELLRD